MRSRQIKNFSCAHYQGTRRTRIIDPPLDMRSSTKRIPRRERIKKKKLHRIKNSYHRKL